MRGEPQSNRDAEVWAEVQRVSDTGDLGKNGLVRHSGIEAKLWRTQQGTRSSHFLKTQAQPCSGLSSWVLLRLSGCSSWTCKSLPEVAAPRCYCAGVALQNAQRHASKVEAVAPHRVGGGACPRGRRQRRHVAGPRTGKREVLWTEAPERGPGRDGARAGLCREGGDEQRAGLRGQGRPCWKGERQGLTFHGCEAEGPAWPLLRSCGMRGWKGSWKGQVTPLRPERESTCSRQ